MGSISRPTIAPSLFHNEGIWLQNFPREYKPIFYYNVDDTLLSFTSKNEVNKFLENLNCQHGIIKFT